MKQLKHIFSFPVYFSFFLLSIGGFKAAADLPAIIRGKVVKFDKNKVVLSQRDGQVKIEVPRSSIPDHYELKTGRPVQAELDGASVVRQMKEHAKEAKKNHTTLKREIKAAKKRGKKSELKRLNKKANKPKTVKFE